MTLTTNQLTDLRKEFIEFKINEMTTEDMYAYIRDIMIHDVNVLNQEELEYEINSYDDFLYDILVSYVKDEENSYENYRSSYMRDTKTIGLTTNGN